MNLMASGNVDVTYSTVLSLALRILRRRRKLRDLSSPPFFLSNCSLSMLIAFSFFLHQSKLDQYLPFQTSLSYSPIRVRVQQVTLHSYSIVSVIVAFVPFFVSTIIPPACDQLFTSTASVIKYLHSSMDFQ